MKRFYFILLLLAALTLPSARAQELPSAMLEGLDSFTDSESGYVCTPLDGTPFAGWLTARFPGNMARHEHFCALTGMDRNIVAAQFDAKDAGAYLRISLPETVSKDGVDYAVVAIDGLDYEGISISDTWTFSLPDNLIYIGANGLRNVNALYWSVGMQLREIEENGLLVAHDSEISFAGFVPPILHGELSEVSTSLKVEVKDETALAYFSWPYLFNKVLYWRTAGPLQPQGFRKDGFDSSVCYGSQALLSGILDEAATDGEVTLPLLHGSLGNSWTGVAGRLIHNEWRPQEDADFVGISSLSAPLRRLNIPEGYAIICPNAFDQLEAEEIVIPSTMLKIFPTALKNVRGLKRIILNTDADNEIISYDEAFADLPAGVTLVADTKALDIHPLTAPWNRFEKIIDTRAFAEVGTVAAEEAAISVGAGHLDVTSAGHAISVFNAAGALVATAHSNLSASLPTGLYIVVTDAGGRHKIVVP